MIIVFIFLSTKLFWEWSSFFRSSKWFWSASSCLPPGFLVSTSSTRVSSRTTSGFFVLRAMLGSVQNLIWSTKLAAEYFLKVGLETVQTWKFYNKSRNLAHKMYHFSKHSIPQLIPKSPTLKKSPHLMTEQFCQFDFLHRKLSYTFSIKNVPDVQLSTIRCTASPLPSRRQLLLVFGCGKERTVYRLADCRIKPISVFVRVYFAYLVLFSKDVLSSSWDLPC